MALSWDITNCNNIEEIKSDTEWGRTEALIWTTMVIGLREITEDNADEFYKRIKMVEKVSGELCIKDSAPYFFTKEDIVKRIGLRTNSTVCTKAQFNKHVLGLLNQQVERELSYQTA